MYKQEIIDEKVKSAREKPDPVIKGHFPNPENNSKSGDIMEILFKELKDDMREREIRMEKRYQEQQELTLNKIEKILDGKLSNTNDEIRNLKEEVKDVKNSNFRWGEYGDGFRPLVRNFRPVNAE